MLTNIENRLEELFESIEMMPPDKVDLAEKVSKFLLWKTSELVSYKVNRPIGVRSNLAFDLTHRLSLTSSMGF